MKRMYESSEVKEKFAILLSKLHQVNILSEYINDVVVHSKFFDCFENNDFEELMTLSYESIAEKVFNEEVVFDYSLEYVNEYYWAGLVYMNLLFNYSVPLKRAMIIFPLKKMVDLYYPYHEASFVKACEYYLNYEKETPILEILRKEKNIQLSKLSVVTEINEKSLRVFDSSNAALFATSLNSLVKLANFFEIDLSVFNTKSSCVCYSETFLHNEEFREIFKNTLLVYLGIKSKDKVLYQYNDLDNKKIRKALKNHDLLIMLFEPYGVIKLSNNMITQKYINQTEFLFVYARTIEKFKKTADSLLI